MVSPTPTLTPRLRVYPVVVGVNHYAASVPGHSYDLEFAARDAQRVAEFLAAPNPAFETISAPPLLDDQASAERIRAALSRWWGSRRLGMGDMLLFYFAGHGVINKDGRAYLCCTDTNIRDPNTGGLRLDDLYHDMQGVQAESVLVILDACFSGAVIDPGIINQNASQQMRTLLSQMLPQTTGNRIILAATHANQMARENRMLDGGSGLFTGALLHGWRDGEARGADGLVTPQTLAQYLRRQFVASPLQQPVTVVAESTQLTLGRFRPVPDGMAQPAPPTRPSSRNSLAFDPTNAGIPVAPPPRPPTPPQTLRTHWLIAAAAAVGLATLCSVLVLISTQAFVLAFIGTCALAIAAIPLSKEFKGWTTALAIVQMVLLVGVLHLRFGLGRGFAPIEVLAQYAWLALVILLIQAAVVLYWITDYYTTSHAS